jgi:MFS transporter
MEAPMTAASQVTPDTVRSLIPARLDRLPWSAFHTRMVVALGVAWILDGLEIQIATAVGAVLNQRDTLNLSSTAVGLIATVYLVGEVVGALVFGRMSDKLGRRNLFMITLGVYLVGSGLTALTLGSGVGWIVFLYLTRFIAGTGIGGEYAAINSAIDEMIPARYRGRVDIAVNGTYWAGAVLGTLGTFILLNVLSPSIGWRIGFLIGPVLGLVILVVRRSPLCQHDPGEGNGDERGGVVGPLTGVHLQPDGGDGADRRGADLARGGVQPGGLIDGQGCVVRLGRVAPEGRQRYVGVSQWFVGAIGIAQQRHLEEHFRGGHPVLDGGGDLLGVGNLQLRFSGDEFLQRYEAEQFVGELEEAEVDVALG